MKDEYPTEKKKFKLTTETKINSFGVKLFRIELLVDCKWGKKGNRGGWVEKEANIKDLNIKKGWIFGGEISGDAVIRGGVIRGGVIRGGEIWGGIISGGVISGSAVISGGKIRGGVISGGEIWGGVIRGGVIRGGEIWGGIISGGVISGGDIRGGVVIRGGIIRGGVIWGGEWKKSPLQIQGTKDFVNISKKGYIMIGCFEYSFEKWKRDFKKIGEDNKYTKAEIAEYKLYIDLIIKLYL